MMPAVMQNSPLDPVPAASATSATSSATPVTLDVWDAGANQPAHAFVQATRLLAVAALLGLITLGLAWELWLAPTGARWLAFKVLPLVLPLAGLLKNRLYTYRWVSLLVWLYFTEGIVRATGLPSGAAPSLGVALAWGEVALCTLLFIACAAHVRWRLKHPSQPVALPA